MVRQDVTGTVRQEKIVLYIQHINPIHTTNGGRGWEVCVWRGGGGQCPCSEKTVGAFAPMLLYHYVYNTQSSYT